MKKFQLLACAFATALFTLSFTACDEDEPVVPDPEPTPTPTPDPDPELPFYYNVLVSMAKYVEG